MIKIAIVGCGRILNAHLQGYKKLREIGIDNFRITALVARKRDDALMFLRPGAGPAPRPPVLAPETGDPLAAPHTYLTDFQDDVEVGVYTDYVEMLDEADVDAVNDFTTLALHHQVAAESFARDKHLLTQKPLAISVAAAKQMVEAAQERQLTLGTFENVRQASFTRAAGWAVRQGYIGEPQIAIIGSLGGLWSPDKVVADTPWRHDKLLAGGGGAIDIGVHQFHLLRYVFGEVEWVNATTAIFEPTRYRRDGEGNVIDSFDVNVDDTYLATAGMENGSLGQLLWSWALQEPAAEVNGAPAFYGSEGCINGGQLVRRSGTRANLTQLFEEKMTAEERESFFPMGLTDPYAILQLDWLRAIEAGANPETDGVEGLHDLACAFGMLESSLAGRRVTQQEILTGAASQYQDEINRYYRSV